MSVCAICTKKPEIQRVTFTECNRNKGNSLTSPKFAPQWLINVDAPLPICSRQKYLCQHFMPLTVPVILLLNAFYWLCCVTFSSGFNEEVCSSVQHLNATLQPGVVLDLLSMSFCVFWFLQESTMACTAARDAKASLKGQSARIWPTHAETIRSAWLTSARGTAASTAATRSASPWAWSGKVCVQDVRLLYCFDFNSWNVLPIYCLLAYL